MRPVLLSLLIFTSVPAYASDAGEACTADLAALPSFLLANDTGAPDPIARQGQAVFDAVLEKTRLQAGDVVDDKACIETLRTYLRTYRRGHLGVAPIQPDEPAGAASRPVADDPRAPTLRLLSARTALLTLPTFGDPYAPLIAALVKDPSPRDSCAALSHHRRPAQQRRIRFVLCAAPAPVRRQHHARRRCRVSRHAGEHRGERGRLQTAGLRVGGLRQVHGAGGRGHAGSTGRHLCAAQDRACDGRQTPRRVLANPRRIAVLIDRECGSSCEEFVLAVRQSFKVKTFGRPTAGSLDYSNLRPYDLPSGRRRLFYATSRSLRLPAFAVDAAGIAPDQFMPSAGTVDAYDEETEAVRGTLESSERGRSVRRVER